MKQAKNKLLNYDNSQHGFWNTFVIYKFDIELYTNLKDD